MGIELLEYRPHWTSPLCEIGISRKSVYQLTTSREQALGEGNRGRSNAPPRQADPTRQDSQRSVAHGQDDCEWCRYDECLVILARCLESEDSLGKTCSSSWNRLVRTRMLGGVGRTVSNDRPYPISYFRLPPIREWYESPWLESSECRSSEFRTGGMESK